MHCHEADDPTHDAQNRAGWGHSSVFANWRFHGTTTDGGDVSSSEHYIGFMNALFFFPLPAGFTNCPSENIHIAVYLDCHQLE